jgi:putative acyl-CoA dehydrogenase
MSASLNPNQPPPREPCNRYGGNTALREAVAREGAAWAEDELLAAGGELGTPEWAARGDAANRNLPRLLLLDRGGERLDDFEFHPAWHDCLRWLKRMGLAGALWNEPRPGAHVRRAALFQLFAEVECGSLCPTTMTHAATPLILADRRLAPWHRLLTAPEHDPRRAAIGEKCGALIGMGMTERQGGSDVRANTTQATPEGEGLYRIHGHKWFLSVPVSDAFLVTAQAPGGISCFFLPRLTNEGTHNGLCIVRTKDKLGDRSNASTEVELHGARGLLVGEEGHGLATILEVANHTRRDCASGSAGIARAALAEALHHAQLRSAFGKPLIEQPLMANVLADLALEVEGQVALTMYVAGLVDRAEDDEDAAVLARLLTPAAKYWICRRTAAIVAEAMEVIGGNGYVEDGPLPRLYRQAPLNSIWEGAGNIMCLDVLRVLSRETRARDALLSMLTEVRGRDPAHDHACNWLSGPSTEVPDEASARLLVERIALLTTSARLLADGATPLASAFCASRLGGETGRAFGTLARSAPLRLILRRAGP